MKRIVALLVAFAVCLGGFAPVLHAQSHAADPHAIVLDHDYMTHEQHDNDVDKTADNTLHEALHHSFAEAVAPMVMQDNCVANIEPHPVFDFDSSLASRESSVPYQPPRLA